MADVWISRRRWTCKYCNVTINDDVPSRRRHENGARHKQNVARSLKDLYRESHIRRATSGAPTPKAPRDSSARGTFENYTTAASLGYTAEDDKNWHERLSRRTGEAQVGEWQTVPNSAIVPDNNVHNDEQIQHGYANPEGPLTDREEARRFELVERTLDSGDDDIDSIPIITRPQRDERAIKVEEPSCANLTAVGAKQEEASAQPVHPAPKNELGTQADSEAADASVPGTALKREASEGLDDPSAPVEANPFRKRRARGSTKKVGSAFA